MGAMVPPWAQALAELPRRRASRCRRVEPRRRALGDLRVVLVTCERTKGWQVAERLGETRPDGVPRWLDAAEWEADQVCDDRRADVVGSLGDPEAVWVVDATGFVKNGSHAVGVNRQYRGTAGRIEHGQIAVLLGSVSRYGAAFIDRARYLPQAWITETPRCRAADRPAAVPCATQPQLGQQMRERAFESGVPRAWGVADTVYGSDRRLRMD